VWYYKTPRIAQTQTRSRALPKCLRPPRTLFRILQSCIYLASG
jgi:hypothetical protein